MFNLVPSLISVNDWRIARGHGGTRADLIRTLGRRYIELKLSIPMAGIISTVMTCKYN